MFQLPAQQHTTARNRPAESHAETSVHPFISTLHRSWLHGALSGPPKRPHRRRPLTLTRLPRNPERPPPCESDSTAPRQR